MEHCAKLPKIFRVILAATCFGCLVGHPFLFTSGQENQQQSEDEETQQIRLLIDQILSEGVTQSDLEASSVVMQDLAEGRISESMASSRLKRFGDGKLVKFLSNRLFRRLFQKADLTDFVRALQERGLNTLLIEELLSSINLYYRPQTKNQAAQWEFITNTLFIPIEFKQPGSSRVRGDLHPNEINTIIHELDHADKDLRSDLFRIRGKSFWGKIHAGFCWGGILCLFGLASITVLGSLHRMQVILPALQRLEHLEYLHRPQIALAIVVGATCLGLAIAMVYHVLAPEQYHDLSEVEAENAMQIYRIAEIIDSLALQQQEIAPSMQADKSKLPRQIREAIRFGIPGAMGGAAIGLSLGLLGLGPRLLGPLRILKALNYPWAMAITCGLIGTVSMASVGAWRTNQFAKLKAWEISGYYSGYCAERVLGGQQDIAFYNTRLLHYPSLEELVQLQTLDERGSFKLLLPERMYQLADGVRPGDSATTLVQLAADFPGEFQRIDIPGREFEAYLAGTPIEIPDREHPGVFASMFRTTLGLGLDQLANDQARGKANYRGLADFMERSELPYYVEIRNQIRQARAARIQELESSEVQTSVRSDR